MSVAFIKKEDLNRAVEITAYCFPYLSNQIDMVNDYFSKSIAKKEAIGYYEDGILMSTLLVSPIELYIQGSPVKAGGISFVASMPEARRGGKVGSLLIEMFNIMKERKLLLSIMGVFSYEFYRRYGYEIGYDNLKYTIPIENLKAFKTSLKIKAYDKIYLKDMLKLYEVFAKGHNGSGARDVAIWEELIIKDMWDSSKLYTYLCENNNEIKGYIIYSINDGKMNIVEIIYEGREALEALLTFIYSHQAQIREVILNSCLNDMVQYILPNPRVKREISSGMMFRVVDVASSLMALHFPKDLKGEIKIKINDSKAFFNASPLQLILEDGILRVSNCNSYDVECDIQSFSQIYIGYLSVDEAYNQGNLICNLCNLKELNKFFKKSVTYCYNNF
ncbi:MAG TPA: GNAT family N-acetyltransferase [Clostridiaceae bacterium]